MHAAGRSGTGRRRVGGPRATAGTPSVRAADCDGPGDENARGTAVLAGLAHRPGPHLSKDEWVEPRGGVTAADRERGARRRRVRRAGPDAAGDATSTPARENAGR